MEVTNKKKQQTSKYLRTESIPTIGNEMTVQHIKMNLMAFHIETNRPQLLISLALHFTTLPLNKYIYILEKQMEFR